MARKKIVKAVDDVSLEIHAGSSMALIGESGSGKTTFGKLIAGLEKSTNGKFWFQGQEMQNFSEKQFRPYRRNLQMIFQSSSGVFDPGYTIGENILEILKLHEKLQEGEYEERVKEALIQTGLDPDIRNRYVGQISGGQCQRANIARALVLRPELVICDEPVSSLDYSIHHSRFVQCSVSLQRGGNYVSGTCGRVYQAYRQIKRDSHTSLYNRSV